MQAVLDALAALGGKPIETLAPQAARKQQGPADAVKALLKKQGKSTAPEAVGKVENRTVPGPLGPIPVRVYAPAGSGPFPLLVYFHGGGWVIGSLDGYDSSCRALTNAAQCAVVSVDYHLAPEHQFPAAHEDAYAATQYVMAHAATFNGDPKRIAVGGESAGGNLAAAVALMARDRKGMRPVHELLVYPIANYATDSPSYLENANAKPLSAAMMAWFFKHYLRSPADGQNPLVSLLKAKSLQGLPPATVIVAQIDPLRSEGEAYAGKLKAAGVPVHTKRYDGVTHEFFGMGAVVDKAKQAVGMAATDLRAAFRR
ncbi:MAG: alpha/beta hydrolase [Candidatus Sericytochromatia bacterium]|nr:alpha/beta hydrolase [Candidatus Sericytochromatia bacterium]